MRVSLAGSSIGAIGADANACANMAGSQGLWNQALFDACMGTGGTSVVTQQLPAQQPATLTYSDAQLIAGVNDILWDGSISAAQLDRVHVPVDLNYLTYAVIKPGSVLAYMLGLGSGGDVGAITQGSDGKRYQRSANGWMHYDNAPTQTLPSQTQPSTSVTADPTSDNMPLILAGGAALLYFLTKGGR